MMSHTKLNSGVALRGILVALLFILLATVAVYAQQVTGVLGSPSATTTIKGNQIPVPPPKFGGVIKETLEGSKVWWPPRLAPPKGAPNVLLIMTDDQPNASTGPDRAVGAAIYPIQFYCAVLAHTRGAPDGPQSPLDRQRRDYRTVDRFPGL